MTGSDRRDVVTALSPFMAVAAREKRPVLVPSRGAFDRRHAHVIADLPTAGRAHASVVRWKVFTLPLAVLGRRIGVLGRPDRTEVAGQVGAILG